MAEYPSYQSVPSAMPERGLLALWILSSLISIGTFGVLAIRHPDALANVIEGAAAVLIFCSLFGVAGFFSRWKRLRLLARRQSLLRSLSQLP